MKLTRRSRQLKNLAIVSRENAGANEIIQSNGINRIVPLLSSNRTEVTHHLLQTLVGLCSSETRSKTVLETLAFDLLISLVCQPEIEVSGSAVAVLKQALLSLTDIECVLVKELVGVIIQLLGRKELSAEARDRVLEVIVSSVSQVSMLWVCF